MTILFDEAASGGYILWRDNRGSLCVSRPAFIFPDDAAFLRMAKAAIKALEPDGLGALLGAPVKSITMDSEADFWQIPKDS